MHFYRSLEIDIVTGSRLKDQLLSLEQNADTDGFLGEEDVHRGYS